MKTNPTPCPKCKCKHLELNMVGGDHTTARPTCCKCGRQGPPVPSTNGETLEEWGARLIAAWNNELQPASGKHLPECITKTEAAWQQNMKDKS